MTLASYPFLSHSEVCLPRVCTMFLFLSINSSQYHVIVNHVTVFSDFIGKSKVELCDQQREIWLFISCQWFVIKLCGISIISQTDLLCGISFYYVTVDIALNVSLKEKEIILKLKFCFNKCVNLLSWRLLLQDNDRMKSILAIRYYKYTLNLAGGLSEFATHFPWIPQIKHETVTKS